jgi:hypothetical protein
MLLVLMVTPRSKKPTIRARQGSVPCSAAQMSVGATRGQLDACSRIDEAEVETSGWAAPAHSAQIGRSDHSDLSNSALDNGRGGAVCWAVCPALLYPARVTVHAGPGHPSLAPRDGTGSGYLLPRSRWR